MLTDYRLQLMALSQRMLRCAPGAFLMAIPTVALNQLFFILSMMLPLKVIILIGSDGIPRFLRFLMTEQSKQQWIVYLFGLAVAFFLLYLLTNRLLVALGDSGGSSIRKQSNKVTLFDAEADFSSQVFLRLAQTWGTFAIVAGGVVLGLILEWRMVAAVALAMALQVLGLGWYWNRHQAPEHEEKRQQLVDQRMHIMQNLTGVNTFIAFGVLVVLFLTDPNMHFLIGLVMFILTRQVLARVLKSIGDGHFLIQQRERINALVFPERQVTEKRNPAQTSFESLLMPAHRHKVFETVAKFDLGLDHLNSRTWQWRDTGPRGQALYVSHATPADPTELRLKVLSSAKDAGLAREVTFYESASCAALGLSPKMLATGSAHGRGFLLLASGPLMPVTNQQWPALLKQIHHALWQHRVEDALAQRLARSYASLDQRMDAAVYGRIRLGCNTRQEEALLDRFLDALGAIQAQVATLPKVLVNKRLSRGHIMVTETGQPLIMDWSAIAYDVLGSGLSIQDLDHQFPPEAVLAAVEKQGHTVGHLDPRAIALVAHMTHLEGLVGQEAYASAIARLPATLECLTEPCTDTAQRVAS